MIPVVAALLLCACFGEKDTPKAPDSELQANITIRELINRFGKISYTDLDSAWFIEGVVVGNDVSGNIYKKIYLQDETAGIDIEIEMTNNHQKYPVGQRLVVSLKGLAMGLYGGQPQIANQGNNVVQRLYEPECEEHFFRKGYASEKNMPQPISATINEIGFSPKLYVGRLVRIDSVHFEDEGITFATAGDAGNGSNRNLLDRDSNTIVCRNSTKATFANNTLPIGIGSVVGIVGIYNGTPQFYFRDENDIIDFKILTPTNLYSEYDASTQSVTLHWTRGYACTDNVVVYFKEESETDYHTFTSGDEDQIMIDDLRPNKVYRWKVQALYEGIYSSEISKEKTFVTGADPVVE